MFNNTFLLIVAFLQHIYLIISLVFNDIYNLLCNIQFLMKNKFYKANTLKIIRLFLFFIILAPLFQNCGIYRKTDSKTAIQGEERARQNVEEGKGISLKNLAGRGSMNYEFSSSNPMWRASLEILDFLPLTTVDYSGGIIITDWYNQKNSSNEFIKITVRFLSNEISALNLKVIVHKKICNTISDCTISKSNSKIKSELVKSILAKAAEIDVETKRKKN